MPPPQKSALLGDTPQPKPSAIAHASFGVIQKSVLSWLSDVAFRARSVFWRLGSNAINLQVSGFELIDPGAANLHRYPQARTGLDEHDIAALQFGSHRPQFLPECSNLGEERPIPCRFKRRHQLDQ
jgi:hypothetical protein